MRCIEDSETSLLNRAQKLDEAALARIHVGYYLAIYRYLYRRLGDVETARDLTSAEFLAKARNLRAQGVSLNLLIRLKRWITTLFSNPSLNKTSIRKEKRAMATILPKAVDEQIPNATPSVRPGPGQPGGNPEGECPGYTPKGDQYQHQHRYGP